MLDEDIPHRFVLIAIGLLILFAPVVLVALTVGLLAYTGDLVLEGVTPLVFLELYLVEILVLAVFTYLLYRLLKLLVVHQLPASLGALEETDGDDTADTGDERK